MWELFKYIRNIEIAKDSVKKNKVKANPKQIKKTDVQSKF